MKYTTFLCLGFVLLSLSTVFTAWYGVQVLLVNFSRNDIPVAMQETERQKFEQNINTAADNPEKLQAMALLFLGWTYDLDQSSCELAEQGMDVVIGVRRFFVLNCFVLLGLWLVVCAAVKNQKKKRSGVEKESPIKGFD